MFQCTRKTPPVSGNEQSAVLKEHKTSFFIPHLAQIFHIGWQGCIWNSTTLQIHRNSKSVPQNCPFSTSTPCRVFGWWLDLSSSHPSPSFAVTICAARRRPPVSLGCFPGSRDCAWLWSWQLGTAGWCGLWAGSRSWTAPLHPGGHRVFAGTRWCCQNDSRSKSAGSSSLGDRWMQRCEED